MGGELERVRKALRELGKTIESLPADPAPGAVHKLRTAARRVEAIAAVLQFSGGKESRRLVKSIEPLRKAAGSVREMDVLASHARKLARYCPGAPLTRLLDHLQIARLQNAAALQRALLLRRKAVLRDLKEYSRSIPRAAKHAKAIAHASDASARTQEEIHSAALNVVRELGVWLPLDAENLHAFRLKVKRLRYTLQLDENADSGLVEALSDAQRRIGDWHDWQQLDKIAREVLVLEEDRPLLDRIGQTTRRRFERALAAANALRGKYLAMPLANGI
jgi:CHAD domain-containing protein